MVNEIPEELICRAQQSWVKDPDPVFYYKTETILRMIPDPPNWISHHALFDLLLEIYKSRTSVQSCLQRLLEKKLIKVIGKYKSKYYQKLPRNPKRSESHAPQP
jgi:predicted metal-dependent hydrolase